MAKSVFRLPLRKRLSYDPSDGGDHRTNVHSGGIGSGAHGPFGGTIGIVDFGRHRVRGRFRGRRDRTGIAAQVAGKLYDGRPKGHDRRCCRADDASSRARARLVDLDGIRRVFDPEGFRPDACDHRSEARRSFSGLRAGGGGGPENPERRDQEHDRRNLGRQRRRAGCDP